MALQEHVAGRPEVLELTIEPGCAPLRCGVDVVLDVELLEDGLDDQVSLAQLGEVVLDVADGDQPGACARREEGRGGLGLERAFERRSGRSGCVRRGRCSAWRRAARCRAACTGMPTLASSAAMPAPMMPAPTTAARLMCSHGRSIRQTGEQDQTHCTPSTKERGAIVPPFLIWSPLSWMWLAPEANALRSWRRPGRRRRRGWRCPAACPASRGR